MSLPYHIHDDLRRTFFFVPSYYSGKRKFVESLSEKINLPIIKDKMSFLIKKEETDFDILNIQYTGFKKIKSNNIIPLLEAMLQ